MNTIQYITRKGTFDSGHRVVNQNSLCRNPHGHSYLYDLTFAFNSQKAIGYALDFKEIKRIGCQWIDDYLDHGSILNPHDTELLKTYRNSNYKIWEMSLNGEGNYCNPTVENIAKEIFLAMDILFLPFENYLRIHKIKLHETPNCYTICKKESISNEEKKNFYEVRAAGLHEYKEKKGTIEYDDRIGGERYKEKDKDKL